MTNTTNPEGPKQMSGAGPKEIAEFQQVGCTACNEDGWFRRSEPTPAGSWYDACKACDGFGYKLEEVVVKGLASKER